MAPVLPSYFNGDAVLVVLCSTMSCVPNRPTGRELFSLSFGLNTEWRCTHMSPLVVYVVVDVVVDILTTSICAFVFCDACYGANASFKIHTVPNARSQPLSRWS